MRKKRYWKDNRSITASEDDGDTYLETKDEHRETVLVLDTETNQQLVLDLVTEEDTDKYFVQPNEQEDKDETETISSTSTADYDREEVEKSLQAIALFTE